MGLWFVDSKKLVTICFPLGYLLLYACSPSGAPSIHPAGHSSDTQSPHSNVYSSVIIEDIPHVRQKPDFCGEACVEMYLRKLGEDGDQDFVFDKSGVNPSLGRGCYARDLDVALRSIGFKVGKIWTKYEKSSDAEEAFSALHADLKSKIPSIVGMHYSDWPHASEHFRLILGYDATTDEVIYHEPAEDDGAYKRLKRKMFLKLWPIGSGSKKTLIRFRLEAGDLEYTASSTQRTGADYSQYVMKLKKIVPREFTIVVEPPFVIIGNESSNRVKHRAKTTVRWTVDLLKKDFFPKEPEEIIDIWLFANDTTYRSYAKSLFGHTPTTPYGYFDPEINSIIMNIDTGGGTLVHEMVHPFTRANFPGCPSWFFEGLGSLFEACGEKNGHIVGLINWRLDGLQEVVRQGRLRTFFDLTKTTRSEFYEIDSGLNYAQSRYLLYYLQEKGLLRKYYTAFHQIHQSDPTGYNTLKEILGEEDMSAFQDRWEEWVLGLSNS